MSISGEEVRVGVGGVDWGGQSGGCRQVACLPSPPPPPNQHSVEDKPEFQKAPVNISARLEPLSSWLPPALQPARLVLSCIDLVWSGLVWLTIKKLSTSRRFSLFWTCGFRPECLFSSSLAIFNKSLKVSEKFQSKSRRTGSINEIQSSSSTPVWSDTQWLILIESSIGCCEIIIR